jgi:lysophospholipid acyltransferase (LPLAT)-like uncharacterized protein
MTDSAEAPTPPPAKRSRSGRKMTFWRSLGNYLIVVLGSLLLEVLWRTGRIRFVGEERLRALIKEHGAVVPVCWHQHLLLCGRYSATWRFKRLGIKMGYLISPSLDGEAPTMLARLYGGEVIRGSGTYTGSQAVRALYKQLKRDKLSPLITPDGPRGPRFEFKGGALTLAQLCGVPVVPLAYAAKPAKVLGTWDKFVLPFPFSKVVMAIGEPFFPPRKATADEMVEMQAAMAERLHETYRLAHATLTGNAPEPAAGDTAI